MVWQLFIFQSRWSTTKRWQVAIKVKTRISFTTHFMLVFSFMRSFIQFMHMSSWPIIWCKVKTSMLKRLWTNFSPFIDFIKYYHQSNLCNFYTNHSNVHSTRKQSYIDFSITVDHDKLKCLHLKLHLIWWILWASVKCDLPLTFV